MTDPERRLWSMVRRKQQHLRFHRQHPIGPYILDFYCADAKLCVEFDGPAHEGREEADARRTEWLSEQGIRVIRFSVAEIEMRPAAILAAIAQAAAPSTA